MPTEPRYTYQVLGSSQFPMINGVAPEDPSFPYQSIGLSQDDEDAGEEPGPPIDYHVLHILIQMCRSKLTKQDFKNIDVLIYCRRQFHRTREDHAFYSRGINDALAYQTILVQERENILKAGRDRAALEKVKQNHKKFMRNRQEMSLQRKKVAAYKKRSDAAGAVLRSVKEQILKSETPRMVWAAQKLYEHALAK
ncbi:MAG: hypothetical protein Q9183_005832, partial [Haloplaca sp. 2 TL-2023]